MKIRSTFMMSARVRATAAVVLLCACGVANAQEATTAYVVQVTQVRPGMGDEWVAAQRDEVNPALKKVGVANRTLLETVFGNQGEYVSIRPLDYAEYDAEGILQRALGARAGETLIAKLQSYTVSQTRYVITRQNEFNVGGTNAPIWVTASYRINPGQGDLYRAFMRERLLTLNKQAAEGGRIAGFTVSITGAGSPEPGLWNQTTYLPNVAALNAGGVPAQLLGPPGAALLNRDAAQLRTVVRQVIRRRIAEASF
jgi:hypothetical protein